MEKRLLSIVGLATTFAFNGCASLHTDKIHSALDLIGAESVKSLEFSGTGQWYQFGQAPNPDLPWPPFNVKNYTATINYDKASAKVHITRSQVIEAGRNRPVPVEQKVDQYIVGNVAWNVTQSGVNSTVSPQPNAFEERSAEIWASPQGFLKAALAHKALSKEVGDVTEVTFNLDDKHRYVGILNNKHQLTKVKTWIDNPVLGDTLVETAYSDYRAFKDIQFPTHIIRTQGGYPVLDLTIQDVKLNPSSDYSIPAEAYNKVGTQVTATPLAEGIYYLTGGTHHSVAIEQKDHIVLVEAPLNEERSLALIEKLKTTIPNKPIKYLINTHAHFDHAGGLRTFVDIGTHIVTHQPNQSYYEKIWKNPHNINPDKLQKSQKPANFISFSGKQVLTDGQRNIEIHSLAGNSHNDAFVLVYLPKEKILIEADAYTPTAPNTPQTTPPNPYSVNLYDNIQKLKLNVDQIAALHGPRVATINDLRNAIGIGNTAH